MSMAKCELKSVHHCPVEGCIYAFGSERSFSTKKLLNQHKGKVHAEKKYTCSKCQKGFGTNWLKEHHELTCGKAWICVTCKQSYCSRESLLSHARRKEHDLTEEVKKPPRMVAKIKKKTYSHPVVFLIQPIIQSEAVQMLSRVKPTNRVILPKSTVPLQYNFLPSKPVLAPAIIKEPVVPTATVVDSRTIKVPSPVMSLPPMVVKEPVKSERKQKLIPRTAAETQTCEELESLRRHISRSLESRGSQSYAQGMKRPVGIESTHTQTTESSVNRIKRKSVGNRSRRKSLWSDLEEFMLPKDPMKANRSSGTQTIANLKDISKEMRDSQTLTDIDLFPLALSTIVEQEQMQASSTSDAVDQMSTVEAPNSTPAMLEPLDLWSGNVNSENCAKYDSLLTSVLSDCNTSVNTTSMDTQKDPSFNTDISDDLSSILDTLNAFADTVAPPVLLHTETQTNSPCDMDYISYLANTETQTNDDFLFSDLEFSDTETQTPWDDIPNLGDELVDQLSIEIQTDFSMVSPFTPTAHMETQTADLRQIPELTNSEAQTLIASSYLFN